MRGLVVFQGFKRHDCDFVTSLKLVVSFGFWVKPPESPANSDSITIFDFCFNKEVYWRNLDFLVICYRVSASLGCSVFNKYKFVEYASE